MDQALGQRLRRVNEDELRTLLCDLLRDEGINEDRELVDFGVAYRCGALLPIDDPAGAVLLVEWDDEDAALAAGSAGLAARLWLEANARVESDDDSVWDHRRLRLDVVTDRVDV